MLEQTRLNNIISYAEIELDIEDREKVLHIKISPEKTLNFLKGILKNSFDSAVIHLGDCKVQYKEDFERKTILESTGFKEEI